MTQLNVKGKEQGHNKAQRRAGSVPLGGKTLDQRARHFLVFTNDASANPLSVDLFTCREVAGAYKGVVCVTMGSYAPATAQVYAPNCDEHEHGRALACMAASGARLSDLTEEELIEHVLDQVISSQRIEGITVDRDTLRALLHGELRS